MPVSDRYSRLFQSVLFPLWETAVRGRNTPTLIAQLERTQWRSRDEIEALRVGALRRLLDHAYRNVPFYRSRFDALSMTPGDIRSIADLAQLPVLTRDQGIESYTARRSLRGPRPTISKSTGGTTGQPMRFGYDAGSEDFRQAVKLRGWGWAGYRMGAPTLYYWLLPRAPSRAQQLKMRVDRALKRETYIDCTHRSIADMDAVVASIRKTRPETIVTFSQAIADLARHINQGGLRTWETIPVLCSAERLSPADRAEVAEAFGPAVYETYGCREMMLIAAECEAHAGMHSSAENIIVEVIVTDLDGSQRAADPGESGDVVLTDLHNFGMPFIRYAIGDRAILAKEGMCSCGRSLPRIASIEGRVAETLRDGAGANVSGLLFNVLLTPYASQVRQFQAVQHKHGGITLKLVENQNLDEVTRAAIQLRSRDLVPGIDVQALIVDEIPLARSGKRQIVIVEK